MSENTIEILILAHDIASNTLNQIGDEAGSLGDKFMDMGNSLTLATAGVSASLIASTSSAIQFNESMTNTSAVLGLASEEQAALSQEILDFSRTTRAGAQEVSEAFYDIVGGVADASTHMAILEAATRTAEAGNADLGGTTSGLISIMNSYKFSADQAAFASDVLTNVVGKGVGTMDEFAAALPQVAGLASSLGIGFDDLGASMAYITTQGFTASQAATQLQAIMTSLLNPNAAMVEALEELGYANGQAAIEALGLVGAMDAISGTNSVLENGLAATVGSVEALNGTIALTTDEAASAMNNFTGSVEGATDAAREIQMSSPAAQMDLLNSQIAAISITVGTVFLPAINGVISGIMPMLDGLFDWMSANPQLTATVVGVAAAISALGPILIAIGAGLTILTSPITLVIGGLAALAAAWYTNFGGIQDFVQPVIDNLAAGFDYILQFMEFFTSEVQSVGLGNAILSAFGIGPSAEANGESFIEGIAANFLGASGIATGSMREMAVSISDTLQGVAVFVIGTVIPRLQEFADWFTTTGLPAAVNFVTSVVIPGLQSLGAMAVDIWTQAQPALFSFADWFMTSALPSAIAYVTGTVIPGIQSFIGTVINIWNETQPMLFAFWDWFTVTALPAISTFITGTIIPMVEGFIGTLVRIWTDVSPFLFSIADWFMTSALPAIMSFITDVAVPVIEFFIGKIIDIWNLSQPVLQTLYDWFITTGLPFVNTALDATSEIFETFTAVVAGIWTIIEPVLDLVLDWFIASGMNLIMDVIQDQIDYVNLLIDAFTAIWTSIEPYMDDLQTGIASTFDWIRVNVIDPMVSAIEGVAQTWADVSNAVSGALGLGTTTQVGTSGSFGGTRDVGGSGYAGQSYMIGTGAQPEMFVPRTAGTFIPNADQLGGGGQGNQTSYQVSVSVTERELLSEEDAEANGEILGKRIMEELTYRG